MDTIRCLGQEVGECIVAWLQNNRPMAKLVVFEGMRGAGKSRALKYVQAQWVGPINALSLDELIPKGALADGEDWTDGVLRHAGEAAIRGMLERPGISLIEGPAAWRVLSKIQLPYGLPTARVYIKRMAISGGVAQWMDIETVEVVWRSEGDPLANLDRYHRDERPDLSADLIIERLDHS